MAKVVFTPNIQRHVCVPKTKCNVMVMKSTQDRICRDVADPLNGARLCQQGLQFFPDKAVALREMHRVLAGNDRLALSVWNNVGIYNTAVGAALTRFVGSDVAARFNASRKTPTADELRRLVTEARFSDVKVSVSRINVHLPR